MPHDRVPLDPEGYTHPSEYAWRDLVLGRRLAQGLAEFTPCLEIPWHRPRQDVGVLSDLLLYVHYVQDVLC